METKILSAFTVKKKKKPKKQLYNIPLDLPIKEHSHCSYIKQIYSSFTGKTGEILASSIGKGTSPHGLLQVQLKCVPYL